MLGSSSSDQTIQCFGELLATIETRSSFENAVLLIDDLMQIGQTDFDTLRFLDWLAERASVHVQSEDVQARLSYLHRVFFDEEKFRGNLNSYYVIENHLMSSVVARREGLPVMLSLVYALVGERMGLKVEGLNTPGHFLVRVRDPHGWLVVDVFSQGRAMTETEACQRLACATGLPESEITPYMQPATRLEWLLRILRSLQQALQRAQYWERYEVVNRLAGLAAPWQSPD